MYGIWEMDLGETSLGIGWYGLRREFSREGHLGKPQSQSLLPASPGHPSSTHAHIRVMEMLCQQDCHHQILSQ